MLKKLLSIIPLAILLFIGIYAFWIEPRQLIVKEVTIALPKLKQPIKAVLIGDLQPIQQHWPKERLNWAIDIAAHQKPDIVFYVGDYAYAQKWAARYKLDSWFTVKPANIVKAMARIHAPMGVYAVMGNHDYWWDGEAVKRLIRQTHIQLLIDEAKLAKYGNKALWIAGVDDMATPRPYDLPKTLSKTTELPPLYY